MEKVLVNKSIDFDKLRGGYYTPTSIAEFICSWAIQDKKDVVLEPSCGDGNFIEASIKRFNELGVKGKDLYGRIKGIELIPDEAEKASYRAELIINIKRREQQCKYQILIMNCQKN